MVKVIWQQAALPPHMDASVVFTRLRQYSQVHYVNKYTFVQNVWRLANLYIFGIIRAWGIKKLMLAFASTLLRPPFWIFKMAAIKYLVNLETETKMLILCFQGQGIQWWHNKTSNASTCFTAKFFIIVTGAINAKISTRIFLPVL